MVLFNRSNGCIVHLNQMGFAVILHFYEGSTVRNTINSVAKIYSLEPSDISLETADLVKLLINNGLLMEV